MSASYAGISLCQTTPDVRQWIERNIPLKEFRQFAWHGAGPNIFHGLTYFSHTETNTPVKLNTLRWPSGASRWATYYFIATDEQLVDLKAEAWGTDETSDPVDSAPKPLILHGCGQTVRVDSMWLLPPRPVSATPSWARANKMWLCCLVDQRYWWNQDHCGDLSMLDVSTWDNMFEKLREATGLVANSWDCPAVDSKWLFPHLDLQNANSLPLGLMIDACAWNVGRKVSLDMAYANQSYQPVVRIRPYDWHASRKATNLANTNFNRLAGGEFVLDTRGYSAISPEKIRMTFANGDDPREQLDQTVSALAGYEDYVGSGTIVFHNRLEYDDVSSTERTDLLAEIAKAFLGFQKNTTSDVSYAGHVLWLPEALTDVIEWSETHGEGCDLVPAPEDGKVRQRLTLMDMARTRVVSFPHNLYSDDLWHGVNGAGSGSGAGAGDGGEYTTTCPSGTTYKVRVDGSQIIFTEV